MDYVQTRLSKSTTANAYNRHGAGCLCSICRDDRMVKRDVGPNEEKKHLAIAHSLHHSEMRSKHGSMAYGWDRDGQQKQQLSTEQKAKHLEASAMHGMAEDHFRQAARSYEEGLPKGAAEHEKMAHEAAGKADKMSEKLGV